MTVDKEVVLHSQQNHCVDTYLKADNQRKVQGASLLPTACLDLKTTIVGRSGRSKGVHRGNNQINQGPKLGNLP